MSHDAPKKPSSPSSPSSPIKKPKHYTIAVIGGGIGGVVLAKGLLDKGVSVHIYEAAKGFGEIGAGIAFGPNSVRALALVSPDLLTAYKKHATYNEETEHSATWLTFRWGMDARRYDDGDGGEDTDKENETKGRKAGDLAFEICSQKHAQSWTGTRVRSCVHRARFLDEMVRYIPPETTSFGKTLTHLEELPAGGGLRMTFADGSTAFADAVVGCDGIKSKVRSFLHGSQVTPTFTGEYAYRALVPVDAYEAAMGRERTVNGQLYLCYGGYIVTYPVDHTKSINMVAVVNRVDSEWKHEAWQAPSTQEEMHKDLRGWHPGLIELLSRYGTMDRWALHDVQHDKPYSHGRVCLLGDSVHASTPHLGAGAGQALEDAYILSNLLAEVECAEDLTKAFEAYGAVRRPRSQQVVRYSKAAGIACAFSEPGINDDLEKLEKWLCDRYNYIWNEDLDAQLAKAKDISWSNRR